MDNFKEIIDAVNIIAENKLNQTAKIAMAIVINISNSSNNCTIIFNGKQYSVPYYGVIHQNRTYPLFIPYNIMSQAFIIGGAIDLPLSIEQGGTGAMDRRTALANLHGFDLAIGTDIPSNSNLDTYTTVGSYNVINGAIAATITNSPTTESGYKLLVMRLGFVNRWCQLAISSQATPKLFLRWYNGTTWQNWECFYSNADTIPISNGGTGETSSTAALLGLKAFDLSLGTKIPTPSNLNDYKTAGSYYCASGSDAQSITNSPTNNAYKLIVLDVGKSSSSTVPDRHIQIVLANYENMIYFRNYVSTGWKPWYKINTTAI